MSAGKNRCLMKRQPPTAMKKLVPYILLTLLAFAISYSAWYRPIQRVTLRLRLEGPKGSATIAQVDGLNARCRAHWHQHIAQAATLNRQALALAQKIGYKKGQAEAYRCLGILLLMHHNGTYYPHSYLQYALQSFQQLNDRPGQAATLSSLSRYYMLDSRFEEARKVLHQAEQLFTQLHDQRGRGEVEHQWGELAYWLRDYAAAFSHYQRALKSGQQLGDSAARAATLNRLGSLYLTNRQAYLALASYQHAYRIGKAFGYNQISADASWGIADVYWQRANYQQAFAYYQLSLLADERFYGKKSPWQYQRIAQLYQDRNQYDQALAHYQLSLKAHQLFYKGKPSWSMATLYQQIAGLYERQGKHELALANLNQAVALIQRSNRHLQRSLLAPVHHQFAQVYLAQGRYTNALQQARLSLALATKTSQPSLVQAANLSLALTYAALKDYRKAYAHQQHYSAIKDGLVRSEIERLASLKNGLDVNLKQDQINLLWKQNQVQVGALDESHQRNYALLAVIILTLILVLVLVGTNRRNQRTSRLLAQQASQLEDQRIRELEQAFEHQQAETQLAALRAQMNPHFIFNCLNSIKLYASENEAAKASRYLTKFARLIRLVLENSRSERVPLRHELEALQLYGEMEVMRFKDKLTCALEVDPRLDTEFIEIPPLLIQPYVENAIWHGLMHKAEGGTVWIRVEQPQDDRLQVSVTDNGVGRAKAADLKSKSATNRKSFGMEMTGERLALLEQLYNIQLEVQIDDLKDAAGQPTGTQVRILIPI